MNMLRYILGIFLLAVIASGQRKINGGHDVNIEEYPYQLSLSFIVAHYCGAALLNDQFAITAAHCIDGQRPQLLILRAGSSVQNKNGTYLFIDKIIQHPKYSPETFDNDIALLKLFKKVEFTSQIQPVRLPEVNSNYDGRQGTFTGWAESNLEEYGSEMLQAVNLNIYDKKQCEGIYHEQLTERMLCAGDKQGDAYLCDGDSGGPLVIDGVLAGILSKTEQCTTSGLFTKVSSELEFIYEAMKQ